MSLIIRMQRLKEGERIGKEGSREREIGNKKKKENHSPIRKLERVDGDFANEGNISHTSNREGRETNLLLQSLELTNSDLRANHNRVVDETVFELLDLTHHLSLLLSGTVVVDDTNASQKRHVDGHVLLGDSVHRGRHKRGLQRDLLGQFGLQLDGGRWEVDQTRQDQKVIVGQTTKVGGVDQSLDVESVFFSVRGQVSGGV